MVTDVRLRALDHSSQFKVRAGLSEERFLRLADSAPVMVWVSGLDGGCTYFNRRWLDFTGRTLEQERGDGWSTGVHREDLQGCLEIYRSAFGARREFSMEYRLRHHTGEYRWIWDTGAPVYGPDDVFEGYVGSCIDISEQKQAAEALRQSEAKFRVLFESNMVPLVYWHADGRITDANDAYLRLVDFTRDELKAGLLRWEELTPAEYLELDQRAFAELASGRDSSTPYEKEYVLRNGMRVPVFMSRSLLPGHRDRGVAFAIDLTERKRSQQLLRESQEEAQRLQLDLSHITRVSTMGELTASLAHELNQPLTAILTNAQAAQRLIAAKNPDLAELGEILADIVADDQRAGEVIDRLRSLVRKGKLEAQRLDLNGMVRDVVRLMRSEALIKDVTIILELSPVPALIRGDRVQLQQVLLNLIINGLDAIKEAGAGDATLVVRTTRPDEAWVHVTVEDTGVGIRSDALETIFEPFRTSKAKGMGMGLSICRSIVQAHGGRIWAESKLGQGATLHVTLPVDSEA
ncbi:MAG TPA: PAS domain S-box protein [Burkholderiales bacterium]|nr:PAS domain S-box protein [Burkholderiales bacterium]